MPGDTNKRSAICSNDEDHEYPLWKDETYDSDGDSPMNAKVDHPNWRWVLGIYLPPERVRFFRVKD